MKKQPLKSGRLYCVICPKGKKKEASFIMFAKSLCRNHYNGAVICLNSGCEIEGKHIHIDIKFE